jgi:altronate hydrolase
VDGVIAFTHKSGCCIQPGEPAQLLQRTIAGMATHPNVGGCVLIGLGCETNQIEFMIRDFQLRAPVTMNIQQVGGVRRTVEAGISAVAQLLPAVNAVQRCRQPAAQLALAMNCGGSDGNSGITANPALGCAADGIVRHGGISVLAETPEIYGAEHLLTRRAVSREVGEKLVGMIHWWERHVALFGASIDNNPTFGNKAGGLTTIYEKSLGAVAKAGQSPLAAVVGYAEQLTTPGLCFMDTPGLDPVSMTGLIAGGCNIGAFTTGRGSVSGWKPSPCLKIATNTLMYQHLEEDMDINAGTILDGTETVAQVGQRIFDKLLAVASGEQTKSEAQGLGDEEFAPWILGPTL